MKNNYEQCFLCKLARWGIFIIILNKKKINFAFQTQPNTSKQSGCFGKFFEDKMWKLCIFLTCKRVKDKIYKIKQKCTFKSNFKFYIQFVFSNKMFIIVFSFTKSCIRFVTLNFKLQITVNNYNKNYPWSINNI